MKKLIALVVAAAATGVLVRAAMAADVKIVTQAPSLSPSPWDIALGLAFVSDYNFRGITQSNHKPSVWAYFEPRYNITKDLQLYAGIGGESIAFPNGAQPKSISPQGSARPSVPSRSTLGSGIIGIRAENASTTSRLLAPIARPTERCRLTQTP